MPNSSAIPPKPTAVTASPSASGTREPRRGDHAARGPCRRGHEDRRGQGDQRGRQRRVAQHVLGVLLADEGGAEQATPGDRAADQGDGEGPGAQHLEVEQGAGRAPLAQHEQDQPDQRDREQPQDGAVEAVVRHQADRQHQRTDGHHRQDPAEVVDRLAGLPGVPGQPQAGQDDHQHRDRHRDQEHRPPPEAAQQQPADQGAQRRAATADTRPQRDRAGARAAPEQPR